MLIWRIKSNDESDLKPSAQVCAHECESDEDPQLCMVNVARNGWMNAQV